MKRVLLSWSSGKDSAWMLHVLRQQPDIEVRGLLTTCNETVRRVAMHGVREELLDLQAQAAGLSLWKVPLPWPCSNEQYEAIMRECCRRALADGVEAIAFGDLFLTDVRQYREKQLMGSGLAPLFPLWGYGTAALAREMIAGGLRAIATCVDTAQIPASFAGREFDVRFLEELPAGADPCGEKGEFHSFVYAGPMFDGELRVSRGEVVMREQFVFADLTAEGISGKSGRAAATGLR